MKLDHPADVLPPAELGVVHLVGVGGAGLSAIARLLVQQGLQVQGSDAKDSPVLGRLRIEGVACFVGQAGENVAGAETVIASTAVRDDNPEIVAARAAGLRLWPRSAGVASLMIGRSTVAVAGTHGKTTTTAMTACALLGAGADPGFAIGAEVPSLRTNARLGSDVLVIEADESDGAFLHYSPSAAVVTNVDADHLDVWGSPEAYEAAFAEFVGTVGEFVVLSADDPGARALVEPARERGLTVLLAGFADDADVRGEHVAVTAGGTTFRATTPWGASDVELAVPGSHYAADALLALAVGGQLGYDLVGLVEGLSSYTGAARRMEFKGKARGVTVYDSYAHHPTEIASDLVAARQIAGDSRVVVAFQPHLVSRTRIFADQMGEALSAADVVRIIDIYLAREDADPEVTAELVASHVTAADVRTAGPVAGTAAVLAALVKPGDFVLTLGAGDVTTVGPELLRLLGR